MTNNDLLCLSRRAFLKNSTLVLASAATLNHEKLLAAETAPGLRVGMLTDVHYADRDPTGTRHYRQAISKLDEAGKLFQQEKIHFVVELGYLIDSAKNVVDELGFLKTVNREFSKINEERHYVLGNHCVDRLTKEEFLGEVRREKSYYSFDRDGFHFVVLDACFRKDREPYGRKNFDWTDANIPPEELEWLADDLQQTSKPTVVFTHQRLDVTGHVGVKNNAEVRQVLEASKRVLAVFQGHSHHNELNEISGIHYCTLAAMIEGSGPENSGYSVMELKPDGTILLTGYRKQKSYHWDQQG